MEKFGKVELIPIEKIVASGRLRKDLGDIEDLKKSIKLAGSIMPILVRPLEDGMYKLVVGERRLVALKQLGYSEVPSIVRPYDPLMAELVEIEENVRRKDYDSVEKAKAIARYYEIVKQILGEPKPGRPEALTPEQVEKAKQLREQGKSLREIADEFGVSHMAVQRATEQPVTKSIHDESISLQESPSVSEKISETGILPEGSATRAVAEEFGVSQPTVVRAVKMVGAIKKYPALERLGSASDVQRVARVADNNLFGFTQEHVEAAVALALEKNVDPVLALYMQKIPKEQWDRIIEVYWGGKYPREWVLEAASLIVSNPEKQFTVDKALKFAIVTPKEYRVKVWYHFVVEKLEEAAKKAGLTVEQYIAIAAIEKLHREGLIDELYCNEGIKYVKQGGPSFAKRR